MPLAEIANYREIFLTRSAGKPIVMAMTIGWREAMGWFTKARICELSGWLGMILVQSATLPTTFGVLMGWSNQLPPISMVILVWAGLAFYFVRAFAQRDTLYMVSNGFGFIVNTVLLAIIVYR